MFSSPRWVRTSVAESFCPELLEKTVDSAGRLWRARTSLTSEAAALLKVELPRTTMSLETIEDCWVLAVSVRAVAWSRAVVASHLFL